MIKSTDYITDEAKKEAQQDALGALLDAFVKEMGGKIFQKMEAGYFGWDDERNLTMLQQKLADNMNKNDMVDVAALAMMIWNLQQRQ